MYILENNMIKLAIDKKTGAIASLLNKKTGWELVGQKDLAKGLVMVVPYGDYENNRAKSENQLLSSAREEEGRLTLTWDKVYTDKAGEMNVSVTAEITLLDDRLLFDVTVDNKTPYVVQEILYPCIGGIRESEDKRLKGKILDKNGYFNDISLGYKSSQNLGYWGVDYPSYMSNYPSSHTSAPFELISRGDEGFYIGVHMKNNPVELCVILNEYEPGLLDAKYGLTSLDETLNGYPVGATVSVGRVPFLQPHRKLKLETVVFAFYEGGWHRGLDYFKEWYFDAYKDDRIYPSWFKDIDSILFINLVDQGLKYKDLGGIARDAREKSISALLLHQYNGALVHDSLGTLNDLLAGIKAVHDEGLRIIIDLGLNSHQSREAEKCKISSVYRDYIKDLFLQIADCGYDGIVYNNTLWDYACQNKWGKHDHNKGEPFIKSIMQAVSEIKDVLKEKDMLLADTGLYASAHKYFSLSIDRALKDVNSEPALKYIDNSVGLTASVTGLNDYNLINLCAVYSYIISYSPAFSKGGLSDIPLSVEYGKKVIDFRRRLKDWIWDAEFRHIDCSAAGGAKIICDNPLVKYSVFVNRKNKNLFAFVIANCSDADAECKIVGSGSCFVAHYVDGSSEEVTDVVNVRQGTVLCLVRREA